MRLKDKIAVISGSGRGIGRAVALAYAREGASVVISDIVERPEVSSTLSNIAAMGRQALFVKCDVADEEQVATLVEKTIKAFGGIDILVNGQGPRPRPCSLR